MSLETVLWTQLPSESMDSPAERSIASLQLPTPPHKHSQYLGEGAPASSHLESGSSWAGDQALAEAAGRPAPRTVPAPYRAGWHGRGPLGIHRGGSWGGLPDSLGRGLDESKPKHPTMLKGREVASRGREMGCPASLPGVGEKPQPPSNRWLLGAPTSSVSFLVKSLTSG